MFQLSYEGRACCMSNKNVQLANAAKDENATLQVAYLKSIFWQSGHLPNAFAAPDFTKQLGRERGPANCDCTTGGARESGEGFDK